MPSLNLVSISYLAFSFFFLQLAVPAGARAELPPARGPVPRIGPSYQQAFSAADYRVGSWIQAHKARVEEIAKQNAPALQYNERLTKMNRILELLGHADKDLAHDMANKREALELLTSLPDAARGHFMGVLREFRGVGGDIGFRVSSILAAEMINPARVDSSVPKPGSEAKVIEDETKLKELTEALLGLYTAREACPAPSRLNEWKKILAEKEEAARAAIVENKLKIVADSEFEALVAKELALAAEIAAQEAALGDETFKSSHPELVTALEKKRTEKREAVTKSNEKDRLSREAKVKVSELETSLDALTKAIAELKSCERESTVENQGVQKAGEAVPSLDALREMAKHFRAHAERTNPLAPKSH